jgi:hypothetical protein
MPRSPEKPLRGIIMSVDGGVAEIGQYQVITLNRGSRDGVEAGHVLATYRRGTVIGSEGQTAGLLDNGWFKGWGTRPVPVVPDAPYAQPADIKAAPDSRAGPLRVPDERNGLIIVFRVFEKMSYAMVMRSNRPIYVGDVVQTP